MCSCSTINNGPICNFDGTNEYEPIPPPVPPTLTSTCGSTIQLSYDSSNANVLLYPNSYIDGPPVDANPCVWDINGPEGSHHAIIFQDFDLEHVIDRFRILYTDGRDSDGFMIYSSSITSLPYMRSGTTTTFPFIGTPIVIDSHMFQIIYSGNTADLNTNGGPVIEVHLLGVGICSTPCLNGGQCSASCDCNDGFQGQVCEQTTPQDYTCLVKNAYVKPYFAYPVQLYAIAGTNTISSDSFNFHVYNFKSSYTYESLPPNAVTDIVSFGSVLSLPSTCDSKSGSSRTKALACYFEEDDFNEAIKIPAIVNPKSDLLSPVGRFTQTVSLNDAEVTLSVQHIATKQYALRWRFNGLVQQKWNGQSSITITNIEIKDSGIYECFIRGGSDYYVVTYRLIVRGCPDNMYGPDCAQTCPTCQNGGTCSDVYGSCICPPGYAGAVCDELLTGSTISRNTALTCPGLGITYAGCKYVMFCLPDPGGCMCMPGWLGNNCDTPCDPLKFGLECQFDCHCDSDGQCDVATGACPNGCAPTFTGPNCQTT
ncbi:Tyrosine-protein kinase receptor Tie-1 [Holothuria leucospilota]|uniref:Tyrosine-protein kinase receptor Tie-1 n=1 Tax=Holothuria leucospilota TaxID=206669 RepID=A0A9Q1CU31_HOLLE|nr:Tyrosine-protein kinase receptor Tie-1 [Holothuria leucospilota]